MPPCSVGRGTLDYTLYCRGQKALLRKRFPFRVKVVYYIARSGAAPARRPVRGGPGPASGRGRPGPGDLIRVRGFSGAEGRGRPGPGDPIHNLDSIANPLFGGSGDARLHAVLSRQKKTCFEGGFRVKVVYYIARSGAAPARRPVRGGPGPAF